MKLPYQRLYLRMSLYIGAALLAFIGLAVASVVAVASFQLESYIATRQSALGRTAADVLASGGRPALEQWLRTDAAIPSGVTIFILDENGDDILDRRIPPSYVNFVRHSVVNAPELPTSNYRPVRLAPQLIGPDNHAYAFLVLPNQISVWGSPATAAGLLIAALLVIATVAWLIARTVGRPIGELQVAVRELALGHTEARVPATITRRRDELGALAADFNSMADKLAALLASRQQLMGELSHELRSPLARLQAALALAEHRQSIGTTERERIEQEIQRMNLIIGDLLRFSRLDAAAAIVRRLVRLDTLLAELLRDEEIEAAAHPCRLALSAAPGLEMIGDPQLLRSGFENIVRNAIRHAPPDSVVDVAARRNGRRLHVDIMDRGPGVSPELLTRIFDPYVRAPKSADDTSGTGLGLAIARRVFEVHGGSVVATPRAGGGLTVSVELPAAELN
ncbi:MAG: HAMP domain-containing histidine kinase [Gammaproteobacteria bacterium]|nr:HAMP domain-containing histidine kinase [Gammaproteobacteria bacterium]